MCSPSVSRGSSTVSLSTLLRILSFHVPLHSSFDRLSTRILSPPSIESSALILPVELSEGNLCSSSTALSTAFLIKNLKPAPVLYTFFPIAEASASRREPWSRPRRLTLCQPVPSSISPARSASMTTEPPSSTAHIRLILISFSLTLTGMSKLCPVSSQCMTMLPFSISDIPFSPLSYIFCEGLTKIRFSAPTLMFTLLTAMLSCSISIHSGASRSTVSSPSPAFDNSSHLTAALTK